MFRVPSSSPPSTPGRHGYGYSQHLPSTTPAGPPPGRGDLFGTKPNFEPSQYDYDDHSMFESSPPKPTPRLFGELQDQLAAQRGQTTSSGFNRNLGNPAGTSHMFRQQYNEEMDEDDAQGGADEDMEEALSHHRTKPQDTFTQSLASQASMGEYGAGQNVVVPGTKYDQIDLLGLAKGFTSNFAAITESDDVILETGRLMEKLHASLGDSLALKDQVLGDIVRELLALWRTSSTTKLAQASKLAELLLRIHHPGRFMPDDRTLSTSRALVRPGSEPVTPIPKVLLDWLNSYQPADEEIGAALSQHGGFSKDVYFWDMVHLATLRGQLTTTLELLNGANFAVAYTAEEDEGTLGYSGPKLQYANQAASEAVILLRQCPALLNYDWDIRGQDWNIFRQRVRQAKRDLEDLAEGESQSRFGMSQSLGESLSQSQANFSLSTRSRKVECKVPWSVYEQLLKLYDMLLGAEEEILTVSQHWIEATLLLTIWWNGEEEVPQGSLAASRRSFVRSHASQALDTKAYTERLEAALACALGGGDESLTLKTTDAFEVGVANVFDDNVEGALHILRSQSLVVASAVTEVGSAGEWFKRSDGIFDQLDQSDLLIFGTPRPSRNGLSKDDILVAYAEKLSSKAQLTNQSGSISRAGWELAIEILGRLDDAMLANQRIQQILDELPLKSADQVDKVTQLCHNMGLSDQALGIALKFADYLKDNTEYYGDAILYYARAHSPPKIQEVLRALVAHCLVKSIAYPPISELDPSLKKLITAPKKTLTELASLDPEAAELLSNSLSGYATIRKYYDLRDEEVLLKNGEKLAHRPLARKRTAANALAVIISSAASSIRGGLYDPEVETVVQVDVLLPLLGEALVFVNQPKRTLTLRHLYDLLAAVEDLSTAPSMIQAQCEEALRTTLAAAHENNPRSLQKSTSNMTTASSQYSLIGSMDLGSVEGVSTDSSTVLVKGGGVDDVKRGWDWRKGFPRGAKGEDVIRILRLGIAKELGRAFAEGELMP